MYPYSKNQNKSSFRIADILHQQQTDGHLLAQHLMMKNGIELSGKHADQKSHSNEIKNVNNSSSKSPSPMPDASPEHHASKGDLPMKPTPMYSNFPLPFPLGIHPAAFHPAAAYLNYADAIHKGEQDSCSKMRFFLLHISNRGIRLKSFFKFGKLCDYFKKVSCQIFVNEI